MNPSHALRDIAKAIFRKNDISLSEISQESTDISLVYPYNASGR